MSLSANEFVDGFKTRVHVPYDRCKFEYAKRPIHIIGQSMEQLIIKHLSIWNGIWRRYLDATTTEARAKVLSDYKKCIQCADQDMECEGCCCGADACPGCKDCTSADTWHEIESLEPVEITSWHIVDELTMRVKNARTRIGEKIRDEWVSPIVDDILRIVYDGFRYKPRANTHEFRIPEDLSTQYAMAWFGVNAYAKN
jgi:hypothetical protein